MELNELKNKIQEINQEFTDEIMDLLLEYITKNIENRFLDDAKKVGITSYSRTFS